MFKMNTAPVLENFTIKDNVIHGVETDLHLKTSSIGELILDEFNKKPDHVAQIEAETGIQNTYAEMKNCSIRCALWLRKQGIGDGDIVVVCIYNRMDTYIPIVATLYIGATHTAWYHKINLKSAQYLINLLQPKVIFSCEGAVDVLLKAAKLENVDTKIIVFGKHSIVQSLEEIMHLQPNKEIQTFFPSEIKCPEKNIAMIILTSGSSGLPKSIMLSYKSMIQNMILFIPFPKNKIILSYSDPCWGTFIGFMLQTILCGGTRIIHQNFDPEETSRFIQKYKAPVCGLLRIERAKCVKTSHTSERLWWAVWNLLDRIDEAPRLYRRPYSPGGSPYKPRRQRPPSPFYLLHQGECQINGMSEAQRCLLVPTEKSKCIESVGFVAANVQLKVIDSIGNILGPNQQGELCFKTSTLMNGYYKNPEKTKETIDDEGWLHTGDLGYYDENGEVFIVDRVKELIKFRNHQITPTEIEEVISTHPGIIEVVVVPILHKQDGDWPMAFVKKVPGYQVTENELIELSATLGESKKLRGGVRFLDELPRLPTGKLARSELKEKAQTLVLGA